MRSCFFRTVALPTSAAAIVLGLCGHAAAQLEESRVLVVYDSDAPDSRLIAEYYAGSAKVPGGVGGRPGLHPGVRVVNLSGLAGGGVNAPAHTVTYAQFVANFRDPLRTFLASTDPTNEVRCIILTRGLPHRVDDTDNANVGDRANDQLAEFNAADATGASMESELSLLWQNLSAGEAGGAGDSKADGTILNPYHRSSAPINSFPTLNIRTAKSFINGPLGNGQVWASNPGAAPAMQLTPGDIYLVGRLDGNSVAIVQSMLDRSQQFLVDTENSLCVIDESDSDGVQGVSDFDGEFDNDGDPAFNAGDDWEQTRDALLADGRFVGANVRYNALSGANNFFVGPRLTFDGEGLLLTGNVTMLFHQGRNHNGIPGNTAGGDPPAGGRYASSFFYAPGAAFNSIESWNGRSFGGLPTLGGQEQAADFLEAGGCFAVCNVWEPFSISLPDSNFIARGFYLGNLTWIEAAYTSMPFLSWQQTAVGDPLARVGGGASRGGLAVLDVNLDGRVGIDDLSAFEGAPVDLNHDGSANAADRALLEATLRAGEAAAMKGRQR